jgi:hypothetical protein
MSEGFGEFGSKCRECKKCGEYVGDTEVKDSQLKENIQRHAELTRVLKETQEALSEMEREVMWEAGRRELRPEYGE